MPRALPVPVRAQIVSRIRSGAPIAQVAEEVDRSFWSVRTSWRRLRDGGAPALVPDDDRRGRSGRRRPRPIHRAACTRRRRHPGWGAGLIRALLVDRSPDHHGADERTRRRWFAAAGLNRPGPARRPASRPHRGQPGRTGPGTSTPRSGWGWRAGSG